MNLLIVGAFVLLIAFTLMGIRACRQERAAWREIEVKAATSGISIFNES